MKYEDGIPLGPLHPPALLQNVVWDFTAYNRVQWVKVARELGVKYPPNVKTDKLKAMIQKRVNDWESMNKQSGDDWVNGWAGSSSS